MTLALMGGMFFLRQGTDDYVLTLHCIRRNCTFLAKGKMAACCQPFVIHYFNDYFQENIPEEESIDLYETGLDGWEIQKRLITPMESCRYCSADVPFDWSVSKAPYKKRGLVCRVILYCCSTFSSSPTTISVTPSFSASLKIISTL